MIQLIVLTLCGAPLPQALAGVFGPAGGTLGRSPRNTLVLDDPDRTVSRLHVQLLCREGAFFALDRGSNPMQHNGRAVGSGNEVPLLDGDRLRVGGFELEVKAYGTADVSTHDALPPSAAAPAESAAFTPRSHEDELLAALLRGLASSHPAPQMLTPGLMERIGVALRAATEGTLQLLLARQAFQRELPAEKTPIASKANNPLKSSPTAEIALAHLLGPSVRGFMPPEAAMRDAYDELRAHQFGVMAGMRAALAQVIARFEPAELAKRIDTESALDSLFTDNQKARLWDQFVALHGGIAAEAQDDFHKRFGNAFIDAYETQMKRLKAEAPRRTERE